MNAFFPPLGKLVSYQLPGPYNGELTPQATMPTDVKQTSNKRSYVRLACSGQLLVTFRDPASPDFNAAEWVDVTSLSGGTDSWEIWYTGRIWVQSTDDIHVIEGY